MHGNPIADPRKRSHQWCVSLTPNNTKTIGRMTCHCFLQPIIRDLPSSSYSTEIQTPTVSLWVSALFEHRYQAPVVKKVHSLRHRLIASNNLGQNNKNIKRTGDPGEKVFTSPQVPPFSIHSLQVSPATWNQDGGDHHMDGMSLSLKVRKAFHSRWILSVVACAQTLFYFSYRSFRQW